MKVMKLDTNVWQYGKYWIIKEKEKVYVHKLKKGMHTIRHTIYNEQKRITSRKSLQKAIEYIDQL
tara:strand:- start:159 stop:353 length:195 start_codon:yes stop_codon:yes gene_type:complete